MRAGLAWLASGCWAGLCGIAAAAPPAVNLAVELRYVADGTELPRSSRGSVVVGTQGSTPLAGSVTVTTSSASDRAAAQRDDTLLQLRVLNGASAQLRLSRLLPLRSLQWAWAAAATASAPGGQGLAETTQWIDSARGLQVRPSWPGGAAPVRLEVQAETPVGASGEAGNGGREAGDFGPSGRSGLGEGAGPARLQLATTLQLPLGEWVALGRVGRPAAPADSGLTVSTAPRGLQGVGRIEVRVLAP